MFIFSFCAKAAVTTASSWSCLAHAATATCRVRSLVPKRSLKYGTKGQTLRFFPPSSSFFFLLSSSLHLRVVPRHGPRHPRHPIHTGSTSSHFPTMTQTNTAPSRTGSPRSSCSSWTHALSTFTLLATTLLAVFSIAPVRAQSLNMGSDFFYSPTKNTEWHLGDTVQIKFSKFPTPNEMTVHVEQIGPRSTEGLHEGWGDRR